MEEQLRAALERQAKAWGLIHGAQERDLEAVLVTPQVTADWNIVATILAKRLMMRGQEHEAMEAEEKALVCPNGFMVIYAMGSDWRAEMWVPDGEWAYVQGEN